MLVPWYFPDFQGLIPWWETRVFSHFPEVYLKIHTDLQYSWYEYRIFSCSGRFFGTHSNFQFQKRSSCLYYLVNEHVSISITTQFRYSNMSSRKSTINYGLGAITRTSIFPQGVKTRGFFSGKRKDSHLLQQTPWFFQRFFILRNEPRFRVSTKISFWVFLLLPWFFLILNLQIPDCVLEWIDIYLI